MENQGSVDAPASMTRVDFFLTGTVHPVQLPTGQIQAGEAHAPLDVEIPTGCWNPDCGFRIIVDSGGQVSVANEGNNSVDGNCIG